MVTLPVERYTVDVTGKAVKVQEVTSDKARILFYQTLTRKLSIQALSSAMRVHVSCDTHALAVVIFLRFLYKLIDSYLFLGGH